MTLTDGERISALWLKLKKHYEENLVMLRKKNDGDLTESETAALRGEIRMVKKFLALDIPPQVVADD